VVRIEVGDEIDPEAVAESLSASGFLRVPMATVPGEFALRGEVMDIFLPDAEYATRIVFEFDTVEELRLYDPLTQGSVKKLSEVWISPASEILWDEERIEALSQGFDAGPEAIESLRERKSMPNAELYFPLSFSSSGSLLDYIGESSILFLKSTERMLSGFETLKKEYYELFVRAGGGKARLPRPEQIMIPYEGLISGFKRRVLFPDIRDPGRSRVRFSYASPRSFFGNITYLKEELASLAEAGYRITIFAESDTQGVRIRTLLKDMDLEIVTGGISAGFSLPDLKIMAIHESEIFGRRRRAPVSVKKAKSSAIDTFVELSPGDYVVHVNYGIGRFLAIDRIKAAGTERDYIKLEYADEETLFIPIEQVNLIQRYIGHEGRDPRLDKIGGKSWENRKKNVRKSVEDLADKLIKLYSRRKNSVGHAFPSDTDWQLEFEAEFPFEETEDQLRSIAEVKTDMESPRPMDRLVCGDVGFGKTEIAMRAAFKSVVGGKQVAFLAPTTILAEQHYENFCERFKRYPVKIGMISRFVPKVEQKKILSRLAGNDLDILIGTHRILQKDVKFQNLGLLVIDEEQRFGVKDKERLKELKANVDCLTLSATPIPRTLHMSLLKIRDMSLLTTPPSNRRPIETFIREFDSEIISEAIRKEVERGGQVFYLHNRVETLTEVQTFLQRICPRFSLSRPTVR
jgi:transcription-repair coupling factor (superfamily II helicase)